MGMLYYAWKIKYDWLYHICENNYNKNMFPGFLQNPSCVLFTMFLQVLIWVVFLIFFSNKDMWK